MVVLKNMFLFFVLISLNILRIVLSMEAKDYFIEKLEYYFSLVASLGISLGAYPNR